MPVRRLAGRFAHAERHVASCEPARDVATSEMRGGALSCDSILREHGEPMARGERFMGSGAGALGARSCGVCQIEARA